jgi:hypothetical protein
MMPPTHWQAFRRRAFRATLRREQTPGQPRHQPRDGHPPQPLPSVMTHDPRFAVAFATP